MPVSTALLTLTTDLLLDTLLVCTGHSTGHNEPLYWAIHCIDWLCLVAPLLDILILLYWTLHWLDSCYLLAP